MSEVRLQFVLYSKLALFTFVMFSTFIKWDYNIIEFSLGTWHFAIPSIIALIFMAWCEIAALNFYVDKFEGTFFKRTKR